MPKIMIAGKMALWIYSRSLLPIAQLTEQKAHVQDPNGSDMQRQG